jgi:hypothetical protein
MTDFSMPKRSLSFWAYLLSFAAVSKMQILSFEALLALPSLEWGSLVASSLCLMEQLCR